ncbi:MAG: WecB/TagA/CpsF family glycosyltransferase [Bacteroidia bacterium]
MRKFFGVALEFNHVLFFQRVADFCKIKQAAYICVVDANVLTMARNNEEYREVVNAADVNTCDGSSIAWFASMIYGEKYRALNGPDIFDTLIKDTKYKHVLLGSTEETISKIWNKMQILGLDTKAIVHYDVPFLSVDQFDYAKIANDLNELEADIIWVSLGAPKQELFMHRLKPFLKSGVMFGIGAAFNFYVGEIKMAKARFFGLRFIWINRIMTDPIRLSKRLGPYLFEIPKMIWGELKLKRLNNG